MDKKTDSKMDKKKLEALEVAIGQIDREFGDGTIMRLGSDRGLIAVESIPTGSLTLDIALGIGGIPKGRVVELFGTESSGKSTLSYHMMASAQQEGGVAAYIDAEHALDPSFAVKCGLDLDSLLVSQPDSAEQCLEITEYLVRSSAVDIVVIDSVAAMVPKAEIDGDMGDTHVGLQARLMSQALRKLTAAIGRSNTSVVFINQIREKIGVMFGSPETTPGGRALKFYSSCRVDVRRIASLKDGDIPIGIRVRAKIVKNKVAPPFRIAEFDMLGECGISTEGDILDLAVEDRIIEKSGSWFSYGETRLGQGRDKVRAFLVENPDLVEQLRQKILAARGFADDPVPETNGEFEDEE